MEQRRFLLAMVLSGIVIFVWQAMFAPTPERIDEDERDEAVVEQVDTDDDVADADAEPQPQPQDVEADAQSDDDAPADDADAQAQPEEVADVEVDDADIDDIEERRDVIRTNNVVVEFSNRGAVVTDVEITSPRQYSQGSGGNLMRAFHEEGQQPPAWPYNFQIDDGINIELSGDEMFEVVEEQSEQYEVEDDSGQTHTAYRALTYRHTDPGGRYIVEKSYELHQDSRDDEQFAIDLDIRVESTFDSALAGDPTLDIIARDDPDDEDDHFLNFRPDQLEGVCHNTENTERTAFDSLEGYEQYAQHSVLWAATDTRYFFMGAVPLDGAAGCSFDFANDDYLQTRLYHDSMTLNAGQTWESSYLLYMGPKDFDMLSRTGHELNESVDYGLFSFLARPLRWSLSRLYGFTGNWGLAIILLTLIIKLLTWPITGKAYNSAERMKQIQPEIKEIREKYEDDQQRMTEETMKLFKEHDVSPLGCLPLLLQMPILYGLFVMIYNSVELYQAEFLWYADLSAPDPFYALPILMGLVMFFQQKITMSTGATGNPQMKVVMKIMPIAFTAFMLFLPAGLVLYYLLNLMMGLSQQFLIKRKYRKAEEAGEEI